MEEMTPGQKKTMASRLKNDLEFIQGGAKPSKKGLKITPTQLRGAYLEMLIAKGPAFTKTVLEEREIKETRNFSTQEIIELIAKRQGLNESDLRVGHYSVDKNGNPLTADIILKDEVAYEKFGQSTHYHFEIKSDVSGDFIIEKTRIIRFLEDSDAVEVEAREDAKEDADMYLEDVGLGAEVKEDEGPPDYSYDKNTKIDKILEFDGTKWLYLN